MWLGRETVNVESVDKNYEKYKGATQQKSNSSNTGW